MKSIYDVTYYGIYSRYKLEYSFVTLFARKEDIRCNHSFENTPFTVKVLPKFKGRRDVLKVLFSDEDNCEYETLDGYFYDDGKWIESANTDIAKAFLELYHKEEG